MLGASVCSRLSFAPGGGHRWHQATSALPLLAAELASSPLRDAACSALAAGLGVVWVRLFKALAANQVLEQV